MYLHIHRTLFVRTEARYYCKKKIIHNLDDDRTYTSMYVTYARATFLFIFIK